jgi:ATP-dependent Clp protease ATP-binding subunit ClpX
MLYCSFCNKSEKEVRKLVKGSNACICNECITWCADITKESEEEKGMREYQSWLTARPNC